MSGSARKFLAGLLLLFAAGAFIGWLYGNMERGLLVAALMALAWQVRNILAFLNALRTQDFDLFRQGDGVWQQIFSSFSYQTSRASKHKRRYRQLLREVRKSTDAMPDGAVILDANNEIVMCNKAAKGLAGLKPKKDQGQRVDNILRAPKLTKLLKSDDFQKEIEIPSPLRDDGWLNCRVVPYGAKQKLLILRDVTDRIRVSRMRRDFVANASHELRSPLTVINGYLDSLAEDQTIAEDWVQPIRQMQGQARRMNRIVAELLELSRLESAGPADDKDLVDVGGLLRSAKNAIYQPGITPHIDIEIESQSRLRGSRNEIDSLLMNLLSNAVRHTPPAGTVTLSWRANTGGAVLVVADTGEGIDAEHIPRLTERFFRVDRGRTREDGGVGLGLAIVKHVLSRHEGSLLVTSEVYEGSQFACQFPASRVVAEPLVPATNEPLKA